ncbi:MAG: cytochrome-c oxidase, cbb3-type subunit II, partial [Bacteroidetes bacterium]|nr:cytochrome-c oxidase, cbb3-type subunit II [Bacteroidota bacterium]
HVHVGALGWNGFMLYGIIYWLTPRLYGTTLYSRKLGNAHFWLGTLGILFYVIPIYWAGITQGLMWKQFTTDGVLQYPNFLETVLQLIPMYLLRVVGGLLYLSGALLGLYNLIKTMRNGRFIRNVEFEAPPLHAADSGEDKTYWGHRWLESRPIRFTILAFLAIAIGSVIGNVPMFVIDSNIPTITKVKPYTPLEVEGRDIYTREGCVGCHSQMVRPFRNETERYGEYSKAGEFVYDHPFLWGSKRTGPDLHRVGRKYPDAWHYNHMYDPTSMAPGSIMPPYPWLIEDRLDFTSLKAKIAALRKIGVPYPYGYEDRAGDDLRAQAEEIAAALQASGIETSWDREIIALIAYLQRLGTDINTD